MKNEPQHIGPTETRIPEFASLEEEAAFWDTHDLTDFLDELRPVKVRFAKKLSEKLTIPLSKTAMAKLEAEARARGTVPVALALQWVLERLDMAKSAEQPRLRKSA